MEAPGLGAVCGAFVDATGQNLQPRVKRSPGSSVGGCRCGNPKKVNIEKMKGLSERTAKSIY